MLRFFFSWLYIRNWHTGEHELSRPRIAFCAAVLFLFLLALAMITILQSPIQYAA